MHSFKAKLEKIGINPFVFISKHILDKLFADAGKDKGHIPVKGSINGKSFQQTLVRYSGEWRLYINTTMLKDSPKRIGESIEVKIQFDAANRTLHPHPKLLKALKADSIARKVFQELSPSKQKEIVRYIANLKSEEARARNIEKAIGFLKGRNRFIGRVKP